MLIAYWPKGCSLQVVVVWCLDNLTTCFVALLFNRSESLRFQSHFMFVLPVSVLHYIPKHHYNFIVRITITTWYGNGKQRINLRGLPLICLIASCTLTFGKPATICEYEWMENKFSHSNNPDVLTRCLWFKIGIGGALCVNNHCAGVRRRWSLLVDGLGLGFANGMIGLWPRFWPELLQHFLGMRTWNILWWLVGLLQPNDLWRLGFVIGFEWLGFRFETEIYEWCVVCSRQAMRMPFCNEMSGNADENRV